MTEVIKLRQALLQRIADIVHIVDDTAQDLAVRAAESKNFSGSLRQLVVHFLAKVVDGLLRDARHKILLNEAEQRADDVEAGLRRSRICQMCSKSISAPGTPFILAITPSKSFVVACP